jgi:hypothetical protein
LEEIDNMHKVMLNKSKGKFVALSNVPDYIYRPSAFGSVNLYDWIQCANKKCKPTKQHKEDTIQDDVAEHADDYGNNTDSEDELDIIGDKFISGGNNQYFTTPPYSMDSIWIPHDPCGICLFHMESI